jgi:hypothetical protein
MHLLSVLAHEIGHLLGRDHDEGGVMQESLDAGERLTLSGVPGADLPVYLTPPDQARAGRGPA